MQGKKLTDDIDISALREMEARGMMRKEIAAALDVGVDTIRKYLGPGRRGRRPAGQNTENHEPENQNTAIRANVPIPQTQPVPVALFHAMNELPARRGWQEQMIETARERQEQALTLRERLDQQVRDGIRKAPRIEPDEVRKAPRIEKCLKIREQRIVLDGEVGTYTLDLIAKTVTIETVLHGEAAGLDDLDKLIRELQEVRGSMTQETARDSMARDGEAI